MYIAPFAFDNELFSFRWPGEELVKKASSGARRLGSEKGRCCSVGGGSAAWRDEGEADMGSNDVIDFRAQFQNGFVAA